MEPGGRTSTPHDAEHPAAHAELAAPAELAAALPLGVFVVAPDGSLLAANDTLTSWAAADPRPHTGSHPSRGSGPTDSDPAVGGFPWRLQVNVADRARIDSGWARCLAGGSWRTTFAWTLDHAETMPAATAVLRADWVGDGEGRRLVGTIVPASDREHSTAEWSTFAAMLDHSPDATMVVGADGRISSANPAAAMLLGLDEEHIDGQDIVDLIHPDDIGLVAEAFADTVVGGPRIGFVVIRVRHRDGTWVHIEAAGNRMVQSGRPDGLVVTCRDVSARYQHDETREMVRSRFEKAFDRAPIGMALVSLDGRLVRVNDVLCQMVGHTANGLTGRSMFDLAHPEDRDAAIAHAFSVLEAGTAEPVELRFVRPDGSDAWARISSSVIHDDTGHAAHGLVHAEDITEQRHLREQLHRAATCDPLTGLLNRAGLSARFDEDRAAASPMRALMLIDLDGFKAVNDVYGHLVGDDVLCDVARRLQGCLRAGSVVARIGGDEFAILLPQVDDERSALALGERVREALALPHLVGSDELRVAGSVGVVVIDGSVRLSDALAAADRASYRAKRSGGNAAYLTSKTASELSD